MPKAYVTIEWLWERKSVCRIKIIEQKEAPCDYESLDEMVNKHIIL